MRLEPTRAVALPAALRRASASVCMRRAGVCMRMQKAPSGSTRPTASDASSSPLLVVSGRRLCSSPRLRSCARSFRAPPPYRASPEPKWRWQEVQSQRGVTTRRAAMMSRCHEARRICSSSPARWCWPVRLALRPSHLCATRMLVAWMPSLAHGGSVDPHRPRYTRCMLAAEEGSRARARHQ